MRFGEFLFVQHSSGYRSLLFACSHAHLLLHLACPRVLQRAASLPCCRAGAQEQLPALLSPSSKRCGCLSGAEALQNF